MLEFPAVPGLSFPGAPLPKTVFRFGGLPFGLQALFPFTVTTLSFGGLKNLFDGSYQPFASNLSNFSRKRIRIAERPASGLLEVGPPCNKRSADESHFLDIISHHLILFAISSFLDPGFWRMSDLTNCFVPLGYNRWRSLFATAMT